MTTPLFLPRVSGLEIVTKDPFAIDVTAWANWFRCKRPGRSSLRTSSSGSAASTATGIDPVLREGGARLRELLAVPRAGRALAAARALRRRPGRSGRDCSISEHGTTEATLVDAIDPAWLKPDSKSRVRSISIIRSRRVANPATSSTFTSWRWGARQLPSKSSHTATIISILTGSTSARGSTSSKRRTSTSSWGATSAPRRLSRSIGKVGEVCVHTRTGRGRSR